MKSMHRLRNGLPAALAAGLWAVCGSAVAQSTAALSADHTTPGDVVTYGMGYSQQRFSPLKQINARTVSRLVPVWAMGTNNSLGDEAQPLVSGGMMYYTTGKSTYAVDALTGRMAWKHELEYGPDIGRAALSGQVNRGPALYEGKLFRTTLDAQVLALDAKTGKELWKSKSADYKQGYSMSVAPLVANGVLITGIGCGEHGGRGYIEAWDPETGKQLWRKYTIPAPGEPGSETWPEGDAWTRGGGPAWLTGSYDPALDLVFWGVGNASPWNAQDRRGDNLYTASVLAMRPKTGEVVWYYQFTPNDTFDFDGNNELVQADILVAGKPRKVVMQANRNGFLYVLDRASGELLAANAFTRQTWAEGIDMKTGRPVETAAVKKMRETGEWVTVAPAAFGGKNWNPMSFSPATGLLYANVLDNEWDYRPAKQPYEAGAPYIAMEAKWRFDQKAGGTLKALDPVTGKAKWQHPWTIASFSGTLATAGDLVFTGNMTGEFAAFHAGTGQKLWSFQTSSGIVSQPITWEHNGRQYVTVASGIGTVYLFFAGDERLATVPPGGTLWTFALMP
jgi:alcohol dehydrogenase (cytochrome c)